MTIEENRQRIKNEALNKIRKLYNPMYKHSYSQFEEDGSYAEQREYEISQIIEWMEKELQKLK